MKREVEKLYQKFNEYHEKFGDQELDDYLMSLVKPLEDADRMYHHFSFLLMHIRATIAHQVRPKHLQEAIDRAERFIKRFEESNQ